MARLTYRTEVVVLQLYRTNTAVLLYSCIQPCFHFFHFCAPVARKFLHFYAFSRAPAPGALLRFYGRNPKRLCILHPKTHTHMVVVQVPYESPSI